MRIEALTIQINKGEAKMPKIKITKNPDEPNTKHLPFTKEFNIQKNVKWTVKTGKVTVSTGSRAATNYGSGCTYSGDSENKATKISITPLDNGKVVVQVDY